MKERGQEQAGIVPTTPIMASIVGALQVEIGLRLVLGRAAAREPGPVWGQACRVQLHPGPTLETRGFDRSPSCPLHEPGTFLQEIEERTDRRSASWPVGDLLRESGGTSLQLDWPITARASCRQCGASWEPLVRRARFRAARCPTCGAGDVVETEVVNAIGQESALAGRSLAELGLPPGHVHEVVDERNGGFAHRFIEVTGDLDVGAQGDRDPSAHLGKGADL
jgi:adenylyltransferase/sulfurtransferase